MAENMKPAIRLMWLALLASTVAAQAAPQAKPRRSSAGAQQDYPAPALAADKAIAAALRQGSAARIRSPIPKLVSFCNRSTPSLEQTSPGGPGLSAGRRWVQSEI